MEKAVAGEVPANTSTREGVFFQLLDSEAIFHCLLEFSFKK